MKEARIECTCSEIKLPDLNLSLTRGQVVWVSEDRAAKSEDLAHAKRIKAVSVRWEERCRVAKRPTPPWLNPKTKGRATPRPAPKPAPKPAPPPPSASKDEVATAAAEAAVEAVDARLSALEGQLADLLAAMKNQPDPTPPEVQVSVDTKETREALVAAVKEALADAVVAAPNAPAEPVPAEPDPDMDGWDDVGDEPVFIPTGIVSDEAKAAINVESEASESAGIDEAVKALRGRKPSRRKNSRKRKKKQSEQE